MVEERTDAGLQILGRRVTLYATQEFTAERAGRVILDLLERGLDILEYLTPGFKESSVSSSVVQAGHEAVGIHLRRLIYAEALPLYDLVARLFYYM